MADTSDVLLKFVEQQWIEAKQAEDQRAAMTNIVLLIVSAVIAFMAQKGLSKNMLFLSTLLTLLGLYGAMMSAKFYERHQFHIGRLIFWRKRLSELHPEAKLEELRDQAALAHGKQFPRLKNIRLYGLWILLHLIVAIAGIAITVLILVLA